MPDACASSWKDWMESLVNATGISNLRYFTEQLHMASPRTQPADVGYKFTAGLLIAPYRIKRVASEEGVGRGWSEFMGRQ